MTDVSATPPWEPASEGASRSDPGTPPGAVTERIRSADGILVLSDFDGTLADVRQHPDLASVRPGSRAAIASLADRPKTAVAVVSGRALSDVEERVDLDGIGYAGNHGLEIETPDRRFVHPEAKGAASTIGRVVEDLRDRLVAVDGAIVEEKGLTASVHYRQVPAVEVDRVRRAVEGSIGARDGPIRIEEGKEVIELRPAVDWDKGRAVEWLRDVLVPQDASWHPIYVGDDVTDEDAFRALSGRGTAVKVGSGPGDTAADYRVEGPEEVTGLLRWLVAVRGGEESPGT